MFISLVKLSFKRAQSLSIPLNESLHGTRIKFKAFKLHKLVVLTNHFEEVKSELVCGRYF